MRRNPLGLSFLSNKAILPLHPTPPGRSLSDAYQGETGKQASGVGPDAGHAQSSPHLPNSLSLTGCPPARPRETILHSSRFLTRRWRCSDPLRKPQQGCCFLQPHLQWACHPILDPNWAATSASLLLVPSVWSSMVTLKFWTIACLFLLLSNLFRPSGGIRWANRLNTPQVVGRLESIDCTRHKRSTQHNKL